MKQSFELVSEGDIAEMDSVTYEKICINISVALLESLYEDRHISDDAIKKIRGKAHKMVDALPTLC
ncbi:MAG: hypothetical protein IJ141_05060 [Lachnospiraceae bacterium]|nr:hypothetical protein [Lachnospiraceae bacterium]